MKYFKLIVIAILALGINSILNAVELESLEIEIEYKSQVWQGGHATAAIIVRNDPPEDMEFGGFDFIIAYDASALTFVGALPGTIHSRCEWEYFTYRYGGSVCDSCLITTLRVISIAETNNGPHRPSCNSLEKGDTLTVLDFLVSDDRTLECMNVPIKFYWTKYNDNTVVSKTGDSLFISNRVIDSDACNYYEITDSTTGYPTYTGAQLDYIDSSIFARENVRRIDLYNGGFDIACADSIDGRGDVNLNEIPYEQADLDLFRLSFTRGWYVFQINVSGQIATTDVNRNGVTQEVSDFIFMQVYGDELTLPNPCESTFIVNTHPNPAYFTHDAIEQKVTVDAVAELGAVYLVFDGLVVDIQSNASQIINYSHVEDQTRIFLYSDDTAPIDKNVPLVTYNPWEPVNLIHAETATTIGDLVESVIDGVTSVGESEEINSEELLPNRFALEQNYPNPFNPSTTFEFELAKAGSYSLDIIDITGRKVTTINGHGHVGHNSVSWDGSGNSSGLYLYKLSSSDFVQSRKMLLLK